jgi:uncharacterized protein with FMN-binding domain
VSTRAKIASAAVSAGVLLIGWQASVHGSVTSSATTSSGTTATSQPSSSATHPTTAAPSSQAALPNSATAGQAAGGYIDGTYTGAAYSNEFGSWTVTVTITDGQITDVTASTTAQDHHSQGINTQAVPRLRTQVLSAQSAHVDTISGATLTSKSYLSSLQSALDEAQA